MVIRRKLALLGLFFLLCQLAAAQMPPGTWFALTAVCAAAIFVFCRFFAKQYTLLFLLLSAVALVGFQQLYVHLILYPTAAQHQGANLPLLVRVEKTGECYEDDRVSAQVTVLESDGKAVTIPLTVLFFRILNLENLYAVSLTFPLLQTMSTNCRGLRMGFIWN